jgi:hypothetical protein
VLFVPRWALWLLPRPAHVRLHGAVPLGLRLPHRRHDAKSVCRGAVCLALLGQLQSLHGRHVLAARLRRLRGLRVGV